jgi:hypothetical protein
MSTKQILYTLGVLVVLGAVFAFWASFTKPIGPSAAQPQDLLGGVPSATGDFAYTDEQPYYKITASYPATTGLQAAADAKARATIEQGLADQIATFKSGSGLDVLTPQDAQIQNISGDHKYALDMQYDDYTSTTTVSYVYKIYADTLGAHPNGYYETFVFDQDGNRLAVGDLFDQSSAWLTDLSKMVKDSVTKQLTALSGGQDASMDIYPEGVAANPDNFQNFALDGGDLVIFIPPYQVAAYAAGSFEVRIPLAQLQNDLKK